MSDRYYVWLDDIQSCFRDTYKIGDRVYEKHLKKIRVDLANDYYIAQFEADQEDEARDYCERMNSKWNTATKESLALEVTDLEETLEDVENHRDALEKKLREAIALIIRMNHNKLISDGDLSGELFDVAEGLEIFWNVMTDGLVIEELLNVAYDDGLPVYSELKKRYGGRRGRIFDSVSPTIRGQE